MSVIGEDKTMRRYEITFNFYENGSNAKRVVESECMWTLVDELYHNKVVGINEFCDQHPGYDIVNIRELGAPIVEFDIDDSDFEDSFDAE